MRKTILLAFLLSVGSVSWADDADDTIQLQEQISISIPADSLKFEFTAFITKGTQTEAVQALEDRIKGFVKAFDLPLDVAPETSTNLAPITSFTIQLHKGRSSIYYTKSNPNGAGPQTPEGTTFSQTISVRFSNIQTVSHKRFQKALAEILQAYHDTAELTPEPDVTFPTIIFESNQIEELRCQAEQKIMESLKKRAQALAKLSGRTLGQISSIKNDSTVSNPNQDELAFYQVKETPTSQVLLTVNLNVTFELTD